MRSILDNYPEDRVLLGESSTRDDRDLAAVYGKNRTKFDFQSIFSSAI